MDAELRDSWAELMAERTPIASADLLDEPVDVAEPAARRAQTRRRYAILREFELGSDKFGQLRRTSEKTAARVGVENLARTAGYPDPPRFTWAVEAAEAGDLADGPVVVDKADVTLALSADVEGTPRLSVARDGRALKSVPAALRQDPDVNSLQARKAALAKHRPPAFASPWKRRWWRRTCSPQTTSLSCGVIRLSLRCSRSSCG